MCRYEDWMKMFLRSCGPKCAKVRLLPVFDLTQVSSCRDLLPVCAHAIAAMAGCITCCVLRRLAMTLIMGTLDGGRTLGYWTAGTSAALLLMCGTKCCST